MSAPRWDWRYEDRTGRPVGAWLFACDCQYAWHREWTPADRGEPVVQPSTPDPAPLDALAAAAEKKPDRLLEQLRQIFGSHGTVDTRGVRDQNPVDE